MLENKEIHVEKLIQCRAHVCLSKKKEKNMKNIVGSLLPHASINAVASQSPAS